MSRSRYPNLMDAVRNGRGPERPFVCDVHDDHSPSASVNVEKGVWVCLPPETRALTADLRHVPIGDVVVGDRLAGFDEEPVEMTNGARVHKRRMWRTATVRATERIVQPSYRITLSDGTELVASAKHQWLARTERGVAWVATDAMRNRNGNLPQLMRLTEVWDDAHTYEAGVLRFLGMARPKRLMGEFSFDRLGRINPLAWVDVTSVEYIGDREVVAMKTSTATYVAEGFASHNCYACGASGRVGAGTITADMNRALTAMDPRTRPYEHHEQWLLLYDGAGPSAYWSQRFGPEVARSFRCGTDPVDGVPTYPLRGPAGAVWGVVRRTGGERKYEYPAGISVGRTLFNYKRRFDVACVIVVEGAADVMACYAAGVPGATLVVGSYGAGLSDPQVRLVRKCSPSKVVLAYDNDEAGRVAANRHYDFGTARIVVPEWPEGVKDPGDAPRGLLRKEMGKWTSTRR